MYVYVRFGEDGLGFVGVGKGKDGFEEMRDRRIAVLNVRLHSNLFFLLRGLEVDEMCFFLKKIKKLEENNSLINLSRSIPLHPYSVGWSKSPLFFPIPPPLCSFILLT